MESLLEWLTEEIYQRIKNGAKELDLIEPAGKSSSVCIDYVRAKGLDCVSLIVKTASASLHK